MTWKQLAAIAIPALLVIPLVSAGAKADLITNGNFTALGDSHFAANGSKEYFGTASPVDWGGGTSGFAFSASVGGPGTTTSFANGTIGIYPGLSATPGGGNYVETDGDPTYRASAITQTIGGLIPGQKYAVSFWQAAGQQNGFSGPTFEYWTVGFGSSTQNSTQMNNPSESFIDWNQQTLTFTATGTSELLSFLAIGGDGSGGGNGNLPPMVFLADVSVDPVPEPASLAAMGFVLVGLGISYRRQRAAKLLAKPITV